MKKLSLLLLVLVSLVSCRSNPESSEEPSQALWSPYDEAAELEKLAENENPRLRFKLINSRFLDKNEIWAPFSEDLASFSEDDYERLKPLILEKDIPTLQESVRSGKLSYTDLTLFYLYRIRRFESDNEMALNAIISLNPDVVDQARKKDAAGIEEKRTYSLFGMPILLKDNINTEGMPTTAGAIALAYNVTPENAFIVERLLDSGAVILGKVNLSEWAYYFCDGCPLGYSAVGGQTLNPYGRKLFETGGSSSGSAVAVAANYAVAAVGTETAGSILSPSAKNSVVGLKPTVGLLSRSGIVPISSTLDTPGPVTKSVIDNAVLLEAMTGKDPGDKASVSATGDYIEALKDASLEGKRLGVMKSLLSDSLYSNTIENLKSHGAVIIEYDSPEVSLAGFITLLNKDMKHDLPDYLAAYAGEEVRVKTVEDIIDFNLEDTLIRAPYGQALFEGIAGDTTTSEELEIIKGRLQENGKRFFDEPMQEHALDFVLSIDNYHAALAAVAKYPALAMPMGFEADGEPVSLTFIARPFEEGKLLQIGAAFEEIQASREAPENYN